LDLNLTNAALPAILGTVVGFVSATYLFNTLIGKKYGTSKAYSKHAKIIYWCGLLAFICIGMGLTTITSELAYSVFNGKETKGDNLAKGLLQATVFPFIFFVAAFILNKIINDEAAIANELENEKVKIRTSTSNLIATNILTNNESTRFSSAKIAISIAITISTVIGLFYAKNYFNIGEITYQVYEVKDISDCKSGYKDEPTASVKFIVDENKSYVIKKYEKSKFKDISKLDNCVIIDKNNWKCGGDFYKVGDSNIYMNSSLQMVDGDLKEIQVTRLENLERLFCDSIYVKKLLF